MTRRVRVAAMGFVQRAALSAGMVNRAAVAALLALAVGRPIAAQAPPAQPDKTGAPAASTAPASGPVTVTAAPVTLAPGGKAEAKLTLKIAPGYRILAPGQGGQYLQAAQLSFNAGGGVYVEAPAWPAGKAWRAEADDPDILVLEGTVDLRIMVHAAAKATAQDLTLAGRLRYQAVRGPAYLKAATLAVSLPVRVTAPGGKAPAADKAPATRP